MTTKIMRIMHIAFAFVLAFSGPVSAAESTDRKPNILLIISDDQGYGDFGFSGNKLVDTPVLDQLSKEGAFYPHFMVAPACTPTRSSLATGPGRNKGDGGIFS